MKYLRCSVYIMFITFLTKINYVDVKALHRRETQFEQKCDNFKTDTDSEIENYRKNFGQQIHSYMDLKIDPCEDFYEYSCGNWEAIRGFNKYEEVLSNFFADSTEEIHNKLYELLSPVNATRAEYILNRFPEIKNSQKFFQSCMKTDIYNQKRIPEYLEFLRSIGGFPAAQPNWNEKDFDALKMLAYSDILGGELLFKQKISQSYPFDLWLSPQERFGFESTLAVDSDDIEEGTSRDYKSLSKIIKYILKDYCQETDKITCRAEKINNIINNFFEFGKQFLNLTIDDEEDEFFNSTTEFLDANPEWDIYFETRFQVNNIKNRALPLIAGPKRMFKEISLFINRTDKETLANIISLSILYKLHVENRYSKFKKDFCLSQTEHKFSISISNIFVKAYWDVEVESEITTMFEQMKSAFIKLIDESNWLDEPTREKGLIKIRALNASFGYIRNPIIYKLAEIFENSTLITDNFYNNNIQSWLLLNQVANYYFLNDVQIKTPTKDTLIALDINSSYDNSLNSIIMYAGIFHKPLYDKKFPKILKYGFIGETIGHELSHSLDNIGRMFDENGEEVDWWSEIAEQLYDKKSDCFAKQYNKFYFPEVNLTINGRNTLQENIADNIGLKLTYMAYKTYLEENGFNCDEHAIEGVPLTNIQLFFVAHAQQYCTTYFRRHFLNEKSLNYPFMMARANGPVQNSEEFANAFNCKEGSPMNPERKCELF